jgi:6-phosphogluconolactonase
MKIWKLVGLMAVLACGSLLGCDDSSAVGNRIGTIYVMTNSDTGNQVLAFRRNEDGTLTPLATYPTGGNGTGVTEVSAVTPQDGIDPLASQNSLFMTPSGLYLFAVNAGSDTITSFRIGIDGTLTRADIEPSGGAQPNSINTTGSLLYVSNVGDAANNFASNVTGFRIESDGSLTPINNSTHALSTANAQPSCLLFNANGSLLFVSELSTNRISAFQVSNDGTLTGPTVTNSNGPGPFGSTFLSNGRLLVTEAPAAASGALSSYSVGSSGALTPISGSVQNGQMATCWVVTTQDERFAYTSNTASGNISSYRISGGTLTIAQNIASTLEGATSGPIDNGVSIDGRYFYVLNGGIGQITAHRIESDGRLTRLQAVGQGLPTKGAQGLAGY